MDLVTQPKQGCGHGELDNKLPPLLASMVIEGLPPIHQSMYFYDAEKVLMKHAESWQIVSFESYCVLGLFSASLLHPQIISVDRLVLISIQYALMFFLDDIFIDSPDQKFTLDESGIDRSARDSPLQTKAYLDYLNAIFGQQLKPSQDLATPMERMVWELGHDMLQLSHPEWFRTFVESVVEHHTASVASVADFAGGHYTSLQGLESYSHMRAGNVGGKMVQLLTEFASNTYLPKEMRSHQIMELISNAATMHLAFVNDIYSYHKESKQEGNPRNVITVLMKSEGKSFVQAVCAAIELINSYASTILHLESETLNSVLQYHLQNIKELLAGNIYYSASTKRYRQPDSVFPELRDVKPIVGG